MPTALLLLHLSNQAIFIKHQQQKKKEEKKRRVWVERKKPTILVNICATFSVQYSRTLFSNLHLPDVNDFKWKLFCKCLRYLKVCKTAHKYYLIDGKFSIRTEFKRGSHESVIRWTWTIVKMKLFKFNGNYLHLNNLKKLTKVIDNVKLATAF